MRAAKSIDDSGIRKSKLLQLLGKQQPEPPLHDDEAYLKHPDFRRKGIAGNLPPLNNIQVGKIRPGNRCVIQVRRLNDHKIIAEIEPPNFKSIALLKFSPSGRLLLVGNECCQVFYLYEIMPATGLRSHDGEAGPDATNMCQGIYTESAWEQVRLRYTLFRGNTPARVSDV